MFGTKCDEARAFSNKYCAKRPFNLFFIIVVYKKSPFR